MILGLVTNEHRFRERCVFMIIENKLHITFLYTIYFKYVQCSMKVNA